MPISIVLPNASGDGIKDAFERIVKSQIPNERWLGLKNYYQKDTVNKLRKDTQVDLTRRQKQMGFYTLYRWLGILV
jgi:hypothetical protein